MPRSVPVGMPIDVFKADGDRKFGADAVDGSDQVAVLVGEAYLLPLRNDPAKTQLAVTADQDRAPGDVVDLAEDLECQD